jgi:NADH dehydrogenase FAD-containing subunit
MAPTLLIALIRRIGFIATTLLSASLAYSAQMATSQARVCASAIVELMQGRSPDPAQAFSNTCYSFVGGKRAMHVANVYRYNAGKRLCSLNKVVVFRLVHLSKRGNMQMLGKATFCLMYLPNE